jgi:hypothetical protein
VDGRPGAEREITPAGSLYQIVESGQVSNIVVPADGGPYLVNAILVTTPQSPGGLGITGVQVALDGTVVAIRPQLNLIEGVGATLNVADNPESNRVDVTVTASGGSGGGGVPITRKVNAGTGLTGGGDLSADRTLTVAYGATAGTAAAGNDPRLTNARTPTAHAASHGSAGADRSPSRSLR